MLFPLAIALTLGTQSPSDSLILSENFSSRFEFARVELEAGKVYRVEIRGAHQISIDPVESGTQNARIFREVGAEAASHTIELSVTPLVSGLYQIHILPTSANDAPIRIYLDESATTRREKLQKSGD